MGQIGALKYLSIRSLDDPELDSFLSKTLSQLEDFNINEGLFKDFSKLEYFYEAGTIPNHVLNRYLTLMLTNAEPAYLDSFMELQVTGQLREMGVYHGRIGTHNFSLNRDLLFFLENILG